MASGKQKSTDKVKSSQARRAPSRRSLLRLAGATALAGVASPFVPRRASAAETLYVNSWGGVWEEAAYKNLFNPFTAKTGIQIRTVSPVSYAKLVAQARTKTYDFDVATVSGWQVPQAEPTNILEPIDTSIIDVNGLPKGSVFMSSVASHAPSINIVYDKRKYEPGSIKSWADFWDLQRFPGLRGMRRGAADCLVFALLADGVPADKLYPPDVDRAFKSLDRLKKNIPVWWTEGPQALQLVQDGEVGAIPLWNSISSVAIERGVPLHLEWNQAKINPVYWVVSRGTPRAKIAWEFIKFAIEPKNLAGFCIDGRYGPMYQSAFEFIPEAASKYMPTHPDNIQKCFEEDAISIGGQLTELTRRFNTWLAG